MMMLLLALVSVCSNSADAWSIRGASLAKSISNGSPSPASPLDSCGTLSQFDNAVPKKPEDAMKTKYDTDSKKRVPVTFKAGDEIEFKCKAGYTTDGSKDGETEFKVECTDKGYYKPGGVCKKASKCGKALEIAHATATPVVVPGGVQYQCNPGYSLDGQKVVAGGMGKNSLFTVECVDFSGEYKEFKGECKAYAFLPSEQSTQIYTEVYKALFIVTCKAKLSEAFGQGKDAPVDSACGKLKAAGASGSCSGLVSAIKSDFKAKKKEVEKFQEKKEWYESDDKPTIGPKAMKFCTDLWKLVEKPNDPKAAA